MFSYILYGLVWLLSFLPFGLLYAFADLLYYLLYYVLRYRRRVVRENLLHSFPDKTLDEIEQIEREFYHNLGDLFVEMYKGWHMKEKEIRRRCVFINSELPESYYRQGKSVICVLGHYGNWEWMASYALWLKTNVRFYTLYKPIHNRVMDRMMFQIRSHFGAIPIPKNDVLRTLVKDYREGRIFMAGFIGDQTPSKSNSHFWTEFLNQETPVLLGTEKIATKFNIPVVTIFVRKPRRGYYEIEFRKVCEAPNELKPGELTLRHTRMLEEQIQAVPAYWLWSHKRWKHKRNVAKEIK